MLVIYIHSLCPWVWWRKMCISSLDTTSSGLEIWLSHTMIFANKRILVFYPVFAWGWVQTPQSLISKYELLHSSIRGWRSSFTPKHSTIWETLLCLILSFCFYFSVLSMFLWIVLGQCRVLAIVILLGGEFSW